MPSKAEDKNIIKIQSDPKDYMFYEVDDLVVGRCQNNIPWPAIITHFKGYDEDEVQVFTVDFIGTHSYAHLQTYLMMPLSFKNIKKLKSKYRNNQALVKALSKAQGKLMQMQKSIEGSFDKQLRFKKMYLNQHESKSFFDVDSIELQKSRRMSKNMVGELQPNLQKYFHDLNGNKKISKQYIKRKLNFCTQIVQIQLQVQISTFQDSQSKQTSHHPYKPKPHTIKTTISEQKTTTISISRGHVQRNLMKGNQISIRFEVLSMR